MSLISRIIACGRSASFGKSTMRPFIHRACSSSLSANDQETKNPLATSQDSSLTGIGKRVKPLTNTPFAKNLFLGRIDPDFLIFPEIETNEELQELNEMCEPIERYFTELDSKSIDENAHIPDEVLQQIKDLGLFGMLIPQEYGGLGLNATKFSRINEITSMDGSIGVTMSAHQAIGLKGILIAGTEEQKAKYLPKLATGEYVAAFALTEPSSGSDVASIKSKATLSEDRKHFLLNGSKIWISNGGIADVFTVFAKTDVTNAMGEKEDRITAFIVERAFGGVTSGKPEDKLGIRGSNTCDVFFDNTPVPIENVIGEVGDGFKIAMNILNSGRFSMGAAVAGTLKRMLRQVAEHALTRSQFGKKLMEFGMIQEKMAVMATTCYAMESMTYMTAGILDAYQKPDAAIEAAMIKVFSSEGAWACVNEGLQILGGLGYMKDYHYERVLRDSRVLLIFEGTNEILRLLIALQCMQHAGVELQEVVRKMSNFLQHPGFVVKQTFTRMGNKKNPRLRMDLGDKLHPTLAFGVEALERRTIQLQYVVEHYLTLYKNEILHEQVALKRFADIAIDLFGMAAVLSRSSRALSIGLPNCDHEAQLAMSFCSRAHLRIKANFDLLEAGKFGNGDEEMRKIADTMFKNGGWAASHPLARNW